MAQDSFWSDTRRRDGCELDDGTGGAGSDVSGGAGAVTGEGGSGAGGPAEVTGQGGALGGATGASGGASSAAVVNGSPLPLGCDEREIREQLSRPFDARGCTDTEGGTGCHESGTGEEPILEFPDEVVARLLDKQDEEGCGEVWIPRGLTTPGGFLWRRLSAHVSDEDCETQMPLEEDPLEPAVLECIGAWIVWVSNGSRP